MKIGTVTFWQSQDNYGQLLQCYAMIRFLRQMGHDAFLIKYMPQRRQVSLLRKIQYLSKLLLNSSEMRNYRAYKRLSRLSSEEAQRHDRQFVCFIGEHIPSTSRLYGLEELKQTPPEADAYLCGSDQIWGGADEGYYLQFGPSGVKRIAYAPSFGGLQPDRLALRRIREYLSSFSFLSSREKQGVELLHSLGYGEACLVPDPTLLLPSSAYRQIATGKLSADAPYLLVYLLGTETPVEADGIFRFAVGKGLRVKYVASQGRQDCHDKIYPTIEEWLELVDKAAYVVTNSFHGTVFSLLFNTPFLVIPVSGAAARMNNRIYDLLTPCGLQNRIYDGGFNRLLDDMDFSQFNLCREKEAARIQSLFGELFPPIDKT